MNIYFIRHGQTAWNTAHRLQGQTDTALNENGRAQAREARKRILDWGLSFDRVYSSPLSRAVETAETVSGFPRSEIRLDARLKEVGFGVIEGSIFEKLSPAFRAYVDDPWNHEPVPGIERADDLIARLAAFLGDLKQDVETDFPEEKGNILVVTHGMALHAILVSLPGEGRAMWKEPLGNCVIFRSGISAGEYTPAVRLTDRTPTFE